MAHSGTWNCSGLVKAEKGTARTTKLAVTHNLEICSLRSTRRKSYTPCGDWIRGEWSPILPLLITEGLLVNRPDSFHLTLRETGCGYVTSHFETSHMADVHQEGHAQLR